MFVLTVLIGRIRAQCRIVTIGRVAHKDANAFVVTTCQFSVRVAPEQNVGVMPVEVMIPRSAMIRILFIVLNRQTSRAEWGLQEESAAATSEARR